MTFLLDQLRLRPIHRLRRSVTSRRTDVDTAREGSLSLLVSLHIKPSDVAPDGGAETASRVWWRDYLLCEVRCALD
jgi:hypothetical protein